MKTVFRPTLLAVGLALAAGPAAAEVYDLCAGEAVKVMPDGTQVPMWGYALGGATVGVCDTPPTFPGPQLTVTDGNLTINLVNTLPEPTSIVIPGQPIPAGGPTWDDGGVGARTSLDQKVRSFGAETAAGATGSYSWSGIGPGTFVFHSGTHPQKQVYMGLYGSVVQDAVAADTTAGTPAEVYPGVTYDQAVTLYYSDIDPDLNNAIAGGTYTTSVEMNARWFLVNGEPFAGDKAADGMTIPAGAANTRTLVRFINAASETHVPVLQGLYATIHAEDGIPYTYREAGVEHFAPRTHYSVHLPPLKTKDAIIVPPAEGTYAVYDGNGYMTNPSDPNDFGQGDTVGGMLRFLLVAANTPPVAVADAYSTDEDNTLTVAAPGVLANDTDAEGNALTAALDMGPTSGLLTLNADGSFTYTPNAEFNGSDAFTYVANDGTVDSTTPATVSITVNALNDAPVAVDDSATTTGETPVGIAVLLNDSDVDGDTLTVTAVGTPANGTASTDGTTVTYTAAAGFSGSNSFTYDISDGNGGTATATVSVTVLPVGNTAPVANDDAATTDEDLAVVIPVLVNDSDPDGDALTVTVTGGPTNGSAAVNVDNTVTYTPTANFNGSDSFAYDISDGNGGTASATVTVTVSAVNDPPVAVDDSATTTGETPVGIAVLLNDSDVDGDALTVTVTGGPTNGLAVVNVDNTVTYTANADFSGSDTFTYEVSDGNGGAATATVNVTVNPVTTNNPPVAVDDLATTDEDVAVNIAVLVNDSDPDVGDTLTVTSVGTAANGTTSTDGTSVTYTPNANFNGADSFTYDISDDNGGTASANVNVTVNPVNDAPVAMNDAYSIGEDTALLVGAPGVLVNDTDVEGDALTAALALPPAHGTLSYLNANGSFRYVPALNFSGLDSFTYRFRRQRRYRHGDREHHRHRGERRAGGGGRHLLPEEHVRQRSSVHGGPGAWCAGQRHGRGQRRPDGGARHGRGGYGRAGARLRRVVHLHHGRCRKRDRRNGGHVHLLRQRRDGEQRAAGCRKPGPQAGRQPGGLRVGAPAGWPL